MWYKKRKKWNKDILYPDPQIYDDRKVINGWCGSNHTVIYSVDNELISFGAVKFNLNRNEHNIDTVKDNEYILRVSPTHNVALRI